MKKLFLTLTIVLFVSSLINAQDFSVNAGFISGTFKAKVNGESASSSDSETGFYAGLGIDFEVSEKTLIKPSVLYANIQESNFLHIPVMVKYYVAEKFNLQAGPQGTFILEDTGDFFNEFGLDLGIGLGYDINENFFIEGRYTFEVTNRTPDSIDASDIDPFLTGSFDLKTKYNSLMIGLGYKF